jgi:hypothetical protein
VLPLDQIWNLDERRHKSRVMKSQDELAERKVAIKMLKE